MRCLGRLISLVMLVVLLAVAYLYRAEIRRAVDGLWHPGAEAAQIGHATSGALADARHALAGMESARRDSIVLTADEVASLLAAGTDLLPGTMRDSLTIELGDGAVTARSVIDSSRIPSTLRALIPGTPARFEPITIRGDLTPVHPGLADFAVEHVAIHGVPVPVDVVTRVATQVTGRPVGTHLDLVLPQSIGGFRVHPGGVTVYRGGGRP